MDFQIYPPPARLFELPRFLNFQDFFHPPTIWTPPFIKRCRVDMFFEKSYVDVQFME